MQRSAKWAWSSGILILFFCLFLMMGVKKHDEIHVLIILTVGMALLGVFVGALRPHPWLTAVIFSGMTLFGWLGIILIVAVRYDYELGDMAVAIKFGAGAALGILVVVGLVSVISLALRGSASSHMKQPPEGS